MNLLKSITLLNTNEKSTARPTTNQVAGMLEYYSKFWVERFWII